MRTRSWIWCILVFLMLCGCSVAEETPDTVTRVIFERGHGSAWGNQFYMDVCTDEILQARYFRPDDPGGELMEESGRPITSEQWEQILSAVEELAPSLVPERKPLWQRLFGRGEALDGTEFHHLTLYASDDDSVRYEWPKNEQAAALEALLEQLALAAEAE